MLEGGHLRAPMDAAMPYENHDARDEPLSKPLKVGDRRALKFPVQVALGARQQEVISREHPKRIVRLHSRANDEIPRSAARRCGFVLEHRAALAAGVRTEPTT